jgi:putative hydrolase of the HAD superfamily
MMKNIIFDFGDIFINLDKLVIAKEIARQGGNLDLLPKLHGLNERYEVGEISSEEFINQLADLYPMVAQAEIIALWNSMLLDFPDYRLDFIENLARENKYRLFLLSNTNDLHIPHVEKKMGSEKFNRFRNSFEQFYLSHEIGLRKPNAAIYQFVLDQNGLKAEETFFVDDTKENTDAAAQLGIKTWNLIVGVEDIIHLKARL